MNGVSKIIRKSRTHIVDFQFTANGETAWSFTAEGDSEIYGVVSNNVASYTINGAAVTLPYAVTDGNSYTLAITKTTSGQVADAQLKIWSGIDKTNVINVPDYGAFDGRYLYAITSGNRLFKIDSQLLLDSNYQGNGAWETLPYVEIALPITPYAGELCLCEFVVKDGEPLLFILGQNSLAGQDYACYLRINTDEIYNIQLTKKDTWTNLSSEIDGISFSHIINTKCMYDFIGNKLYMFNSEWHPVIVFNVATPNESYSGESGQLLYPDYCLIEVNQSMLIPSTGRFVAGADAEIGTGKARAYKASPTSVKTFAYSKIDGYAISGTTSELELYDTDGVILGYMTKNTIGNKAYARHSTKYNSIENKALTTTKYSSYNNRYTFWELADNPPITVPDQVLQAENVASGQTYIHMPTFIGGGVNIWACKGADGDGKKRLVFLNSNIVPSDYAFIDLPADIISLKASRYDT